MKIAIIGAGPSGLVSLKYALDEGLECDAFEQTGEVGGTWIYTDRTGTDENGLPVCTSMYQGLRTNLPKEVMSFLDFPYPEQQKSYLSQIEVLQYFRDYVDRFNLKSHIKFYKYVTKVEPLPDNKWRITFQDARSKRETSQNYDGVIVCNGHYSTPKTPKISGSELFYGPQDHSHNYRKSDPYKGKRVLIIGAGPSGADIAKLISEKASKVFISYRKTLYMKLPEIVIHKPEVVKFDETGANFVDGTREEVDTVLYCTGYEFSFPFLTPECGIKVTDHWVHPLHKHIINIEHPTMSFIGLPFLACVIPMFDIQARYAAAVLSGKSAVPSKEEMLKELEDYIEHKKQNGIPVKFTHQLGREQRSYYDSLANEARVKTLPHVITNIYEHIFAGGGGAPGYFKVIDDENFIYTP